MFEKAQQWMLSRYFILLCFFLSACASSDVSRDAASSVDQSIQGSKDLVSGVGETSLSESYQTTSQTGKGAIIGGTAGAMTGALSSSIGLFPGMATGAVLGAAYGSTIDRKTRAEDQLENRGMSVIVLGDQVLMVIPSAHIFHYMTANIRPEAYSTLNLLARYVNQYVVTLVKISVYTADSGSSREDLALSQLQAEHVEKFLEATGVDARLLYAEGYGSAHPVVSHTLTWEESDNYRIEISFEKLYT